MRQQTKNVNERFSSSFHQVNPVDGKVKISFLVFVTSRLNTLSFCHFRLERDDVT